MNGPAGKHILDSRRRPYHELKAMGVGGGVTLVGVVAIVLGWWVMWVANVRLSPDPVRDARIAAEAARHAEAERLARLGPPGPALDLHVVARGKRLYQAACIACHGPEARGVPNIGKDLVNGSFSKRASDGDLARVIISGRDISDRQNTTKLPKPARGGRADYTDAHVDDIVNYLRSLQDPRRVSGELPEVTVSVLDDDPAPVAVTQTPTTPAASASSPTASLAAVSPDAQPALLDPEAIKRGKRVYMSCLACHGKNATGVPKVGADLIHSDFIKSKSDDELIAFIKRGRQPGEPDSKMNLAMPAKGGNPALKDNQIQDVIVYLRSLQQAAADAK